MGYYFALDDIASVHDIEANSTYDKFVKLRDLVEFDQDTRIIKIKLDKIILEINCNKLDWGNIIKKFDSILEKKVCLNPDEVLRVEFEKLKTRIKKHHFSNMNKYYLWAKKKNLELEPQIKYSKFWINSYDFLSIDTTNFITKIQFKKLCIESNINNPNDLDKLFANNNNNNTIPYDPCEYYCIKNFKNFIGLEEQIII